MENASVDIDLLPDEYKEIVSIIGFDIFLKFCDHYGGTNVYIPKKERVTRLIRNMKIQKEFDGGNYRDLSIKYKLSESYVRKIVGNPSDTTIEQTTIFDFLE
ncbi:Mor transcription activator family protein [Schinkia azotoformans]|uniref:Mor transcription activator family protein n=1 Tax=Schinkia azotoformans TaxID=1454 RepID=UPI002E1B3DE8|nr:Mor transcription activator family protein [Schinkia azotoformans]